MKLFKVCHNSLSYRTQQNDKKSISQFTHRDTFNTYDHKIQLQLESGGIRNKRWLTSDETTLKLIIEKFADKMMSYQAWTISICIRLSLQSEPQDELEESKSSDLFAKIRYPDRCVFHLVQTLDSRASRSLFPLAGGILSGRSDQCARPVRPI